jgi:hypothetical protein
MKATQQLHNLGQSIWLDNITRDLLDNGTLERYIAELSVTGLTSNPTIFDQQSKTAVVTMARFENMQAKVRRRGTVLPTGVGRPDARSRSVSTYSRSDQRSGRMGVPGSFAVTGT